MSISGSNNAACRNAVHELKWEQRKVMVQYLHDDVKSCSKWPKENCASYKESVIGPVLVLLFVLLLESVLES